MLFNVMKAPILEALSTIVFASDEKGKDALYSLVRLEAAKGKICLFAHEAETQMAFTVSECEVEREGHAAVNVKDLLDMVKVMSAEKPIFFEIDKELRLKIKQGRATYKLAITNANDFPVIPYFAPEQYIPLEPKSLLEAIKRVSHARSTDDTVRPLLTGINFSRADEGIMRLATCDGHQLAVIKVAGVLNHPFTLMGKAIKILEKTLGNTTELGLLVSGTQAFFCFDKGILNARLPAGDYPKYGQVFPTEEPALVVFNRQATIELVKRLLTVSSKTDSNVINLDIQDSEAVFSTRNIGADGSETLDLLEGSTLRSPLAIAFNGQYFLHALEKYAGEEVTIRIYGPLRPLVFPNDNFTQVIMPIKR